MEGNICNNGRDEQEEMLSFDGVSYEDEKSVSLGDISFALYRGETLVVFGPENSGVDIICPLVAGLITEYDGDIYYRKYQIRDFNYLDRYDYRKGLGYLQRNYGLINNMSVEENIALPLKYHSQLSTREIADVVGTFISNLNLEHCRNLRPVDLRQSEALKTAYARSVIQNPDMLLVEHAMEGQCPINSLTFLKNLAMRTGDSDKTTLFVTFEPERFLDFASKFLMLYNGNVVFEGCREDFLRQDNPYLKQYLAMSLSGPMRIL